MDSKPRAGYLSLKRTLQSAKYKLKYSKTQEKSFNTSFPVNSLQPTRKPSEVLMKNLNISNNSIEKSTIYHYHEEPSQLYDSIDTCFYSFNKNKTRFSQDFKENKNFCSKCGKDLETDEEICKLRSEVKFLKDALKDIQILLGLGLGEEFGGIAKRLKVDLDLEDKRNKVGFSRLGERLNGVEFM